MSAQLGLFEKAPESVVVDDHPDQDGLRYYQRECVEKVIRAFDYNRAVLAVLATGLGKTVIFSVIAKHWPGPVLVLAHRAELVDQAAKSLERATSELVSVDQAQTFSGLSRIIVASVQTVSRERRLKRITNMWEQRYPTDTPLIIADECFPAGTPVATPSGPAAIESLSAGDMVLSVYHGTGYAAWRRVVRTMSKAAPRNMVRLRIGATAINCTENHPVFVKGKGYVEAKDLKPGDMLCVREDVLARESERVEGSPHVHGEVQVQDLLGDYGAHEQEACERSNEGSQPNAQAGDETKGVGCSAQDRSRAEGAGWERHRHDQATGRAARVAGRGVGSGAHIPNAGGKGERVSESLQTGPSAPDKHGVHRGGWFQSLLSGQESPGRQEDIVLVWSRLDSAEGYERRGDDESRVYNLEVEGSHTYFASGVLVHNCHHYVAKSYRRPIDGVPHAKVLGVTATPSRSDMKALGRIFDDYPFLMGIEDGIEQGWLVPIDAREVIVNQVNLDNVESVAGDLNQGQLDEEMLKAAEIVARETLRLASDRQGIIFCPGVKSAHLAAEKFNSLKAYCAACVDGKTPKHERERITREFREGRIQYLVNCQVATEGFDAPGCSVIALMRCTKSVGMYTQMLGRGLRCLPATVDLHHQADASEARRAAIASSNKPDCMVLDFVGVGKRHKLVNAVDVLGGKYTDDEVQKAKELKKEKPAADPDKCLQDARALLRKVAEKSKASVRSTVNSFDPFKVMHIDRGRDSQLKGVRFGHQPLTPKQKQFLKDRKVPDDVIKGMSKSDYTRFVQAMQARQKKGLATYRQLAFLQKYGFHEVNVSFAAANAGLSYIAKMGWGRKGRISAEKLASVIRAGGRAPRKVG